jgi:hypothetical protein
MISKYIALLEPLGVFALIVAYIWRWRFEYPMSWILILGLVLLSHVLRRETPANLGFRTANLKAALAALAPPAVLLALALLAMGALGQTIRDVTLPSALLSLAVYCFWGLFQQYLLNGYFLHRFVKLSPAFAPLMAAIAFSAIHTPNWFLIIVTFFAGFVCARIYLQFKNLYILGLLHGLIGFLLYLCVPDTISHHLYVGPKWFS